MKRRVSVIVSGRVQGVGYRMFALEQAKQLGLTGYVRNLPQDEVEVVAEGEEAILQRFLTLLRQGPPAARVTDLHLYWEAATGEFEGFGIR